MYAETIFTQKIVANLGCYIRTSLVQDAIRFDATIIPGNSFSVQTVEPSRNDDDADDDD